MPILWEFRLYCLSEKKELEEGKLKLRDMKSGEEEMLGFEEIVSKLKK